MKRIAIVGGPGSGKSTLAIELGARTSLPVFHMDHIHWKPGWQERDRNERYRLAQEVLQKPEWIFEGGMSMINAERLARAELLIWLDLPFRLRVWRVAKRTIRWFGQVRPDMQRDCPEGLNPEMFRFFKYIWDTRHTGRAKIELSLQTAPESLQVMHARTPGDVRALLRSFS